MSLKVSLADYGVGNLHSIRKALELCGADVHVVEDMRQLLDAGCIVFPGVGAFDRTMDRLLPVRDDICRLLQGGVPCLGICIGMQILTEGSAEGMEPGLGFFPGRVVPMRAACVPHMGWNEVIGKDELFQDIDNRYFYFAHSFHAETTTENVVGSTQYDITFPSLLRRGNTYGSQFHPEKSSRSGLAFLRNFVRFAEAQQ
ncbi:MAG: imidazole glycerol phosphate synthase subunit HisH [Candidatus Methanomethylophilaceae archaeon]